ncbi:SMC family ATPase [Cohnella sp. LGH]|uniref:AAA family ATPase n=1 Tax=Cohnella sp. LGH TaxID=1619153 RepID=UPI001ADA28A8|nr:SMC family ATPase [Cohnella sp. LGH]QTH44928.1 SMC family ATPase [Cohnella sp. LGH]
MIPIRLIINNFRAIEHADIDLSAVSLAAIAGRNGAGKSSAFTLAPRFACFGDVISGVSLDSLVRSGTTEMSVEFWFEHQGSTFRVIRTRSTKGKGKSTLEFQQRVDDRWESRSAEKIVDTEVVIRGLLNLDDGTFTASSMILQVQANAFTGATAGMRKEILSQILGLNVYEQLQERTRQRASLLNIEIEKGKDKLLALDDRLTGRAMKDNELQNLLQKNSELLAAIDKDEQAAKALEAQLALLNTKLSRAQQIGREIVAIEGEVDALRQERAEHGGRLERAEKILANEELILSKSAELERIRGELASLVTMKPNADRLRTDLGAMLVDLQKLDEDLSQIEKKSFETALKLAGREELRQRADEYERQSLRLRDFEVKAEAWNALEMEIHSLEARQDREFVRVEAEERRLKERIGALEQQEAHIHDSGCLPTCKFQQAAAAAVADLPILCEQLALLDRSSLAALTLTIAEKQTEQQGLGYDFAAHRDCKRSVDDLREAATAFAQLSGKDELLQQLEQQTAEKLARKATGEAKRDDLQQQLADLERALEPLPELRLKVEDLQRYARLKDEIGAARVAAANANERIIAIDAAIGVKQSRRDELALEQATLEVETLDHAATSERLASLQTIIAVARRQLATLGEQIGGMKAIMAALDDDLLERDRLSAELEPKALRWTRYQTLIKVFGRDGIPALIIENAVPQLERIANEILGQMSKGKHYVRFETQRELKSRAGVSETLDILVGDWTAERPYETYSGGEQLRIDYAIRFALAELLAQRAGSKVEWLTIDEGLGSQDAEHRALVLESIKSVANRFKRVLVITHIEDAQAAFDQVIRFNNADGGVEICVA